VLDHKALPQPDKYVFGDFPPSIYFFFFTSTHGLIHCLTHPHLLSGKELINSTMYVEDEFINKTESSSANIPFYIFIMGLLVSGNAERPQCK
jgi:hypothetical protein